MDAAVLVARAVVAFAGAILVVATAASAVRTVVLPRGAPARLTRLVFQSIRAVFRLRLGRAPSYEQRDRILAPFAPTALMALLATWVLLSFAGYTAICWAVDDRSLLRAVEASGSSITTLGFVAPHGAPLLFICVSEAVDGLVLLALLITYLPAL